MIKLQQSVIILRAIMRLSPRMILYMIRRILRNRLAVKFPSAYRYRINAKKEDLPDLVSSPIISPAIEKMANFYCTEYRQMVNDIFHGRIRLHGRTIDFSSPESIDWNHFVSDEGNHQMWRVKLGHMGFICPMLVDGGVANHRMITTLLEGVYNGTDMTEPDAFNSFWFPYAASHRVLAIGSGLIIARANGSLSPEIDAAVSDFLQLNVAFVLNNIEYELCNNHVERNLAALCLYFSHVEKVPTLISSRLERDIKQLLEKTILEDGTQVERSPMYQGLSIYSLAVLAESPFLSQGLQKELQKKLQAARKAFAILCHPDGKVALFNDAWHGEVPSWNGPTAPDGRSLLKDGGYGRLSQGQDVCLMDAGPIGPSWNPGHGHADFLSVEITLKGHRVIVDPGTSRYSSGIERTRERSAAAHNGPIWHGCEPIEFLGCFKVGRLSRAELIDEKLLPEDTIAGCFRDRARTLGRIVKHYPDYGFLIADLWSNHTSGQVTWLIPTTWTLDSNKRGFVIGNKNMKVNINHLSPVDKFVASRSKWARLYGHLEAAHALNFYPAHHVGDQQTLLIWIGYKQAPKMAEKDGTALLDKLKKILQSNILD